MEVINHPPVRLFRYRSARTSYLFDEVAKALDRKIYFSTYGSMNDPFEAHPRYIESKPIELIKLLKSVRSAEGNTALITGTKLNISGQRNKYLKLMHKKRFRSPIDASRSLKCAASKTLKEIKNKHSLISLSEVPDSLLMWAHYASAHEGIIIVYEFDDSAIKKGDYLNTVKVRYANERPSVTEADILRFASRSVAIQDSDVSDRVFRSIWLTKSIEWEYEKEWRVINHKTIGYTKVESLKPVGIILGYGLSRELRAKISDQVAGALFINKIDLDKKKFSLTIKEAQA